jgi:hypothetical protein
MTVRVSLSSSFATVQSTLSGLNGNKLLAAKLAIMFLGVNARSLAGLYKEVKCYLLIILTPPRSNRSTCSQ